MPLPTERSWSCVYVLPILLILATVSPSDAQELTANSSVAKLARATTKPDGLGATDIGSVSLQIQRLKSLIQVQSEKLDAQQRVLKEQQEKVHQQQQDMAALEKQLQLISEFMESGSRLPSANSKTSSSQAATSAVSTESLNAPSAAPPGEISKFPAVETKKSKFDPFIFSGDLRLRSEPTLGGPADRSLQRMREEFRLRFNADARLNEQLEGGFSLASGDLNNPVSTNQTVNQFYTRKPFEVDRAFINYNPSFFKSLTLVGGKFEYPWYSTELTWDKDINPEGAAETLAFDIPSSRLKEIKLVGFGLPFAETAGVSLANKSITQSVVYGGQLQTAWQIAGWLKLSAYEGFYDWHGSDAVAFAVATAESAGPANGLLALNSNRTQNSMTVTTSTAIVTDGSSIFPTGVKKITAAQFASKFGLLDTIARFEFDTQKERWPFALIGDFVQNTKACANIRNILPAPANTPTQIFSQATNAGCDSHARRGYWLEATYGRAQEKGDWQFSYTRLLIEREAVLGVFNYSEIWQGSNIEEHRSGVLYQTSKNVQLSFIGLFGRPLVTASSPAPVPNLLKRLQFDIIYKF